jgi:hypothetical protein
MKIKLYVKCHKQTGLQYFGKTIREVEDYNGSGVYWNRHLDKHGVELYSMTIGEFDENDPMLIEFALGFSAANDIVLSKDWANLKPESGIDGGDSGYISVKDKDGNTYSVNTNDPRYLSGELVHVNKNTISVKDEDGNTYSVNTNDPRYLSGELVHVNKNTVSVKDEDGNIFRVDINDPRYLSGELVGHTKGVVPAINILTGEVEHVTSKEFKNRKELVGNKFGKKESRKTIEKKKRMHKHKRWITKGNESKFINSINILSYLFDGWKFGRKYKRKHNGK